MQSTDFHVVRSIDALLLLYCCTGDHIHQSTLHNCSLFLNMAAALDVTQLTEGDHVHFEPVSATDYQLVYDGVVVHIHRVKLMDRCPYFEAALQETCSEPLVIPVLTCAVVQSTEWSERSIPAETATPHSEFIDVAKVDLLTELKVINRAATALEFVRMLAIMYWSDRVPGLLFCTSKLQLEPTVSSTRNQVCSSYDVGFSALTAEPEYRSHTPFYAGFAWCFMWNSHLLTASFERMPPLNIQPFVVHLVWLWLAERYRADSLKISQLRVWTSLKHEAVWLADDSLVSKATLRDVIFSGGGRENKRARN